MNPPADRSTRLALSWRWGIELKFAGQRRWTLVGTTITRAEAAEWLARLSECMGNGAVRVCHPTALVAEDAVE